MLPSTLPFSLCPGENVGLPYPSFGPPANTSSPFLALSGSNAKQSAHTRCAASVPGSGPSAVSTVVSTFFSELQSSQSSQPHERQWWRRLNSQNSASHSMQDG